MSERHFRRLRVRYEEEGAEGLRDRRLGKVSPRRVPVDRIDGAGAVPERYRDFTVKHFHEQLGRHNFELGYTWTQLRCRRPAWSAGAEARGAPQEAPAPAAARHAAVPGRLDPRWIGGRPPLDLIVTLDDATSAIYSAFLVEEEGTVSSFLGLVEMIAGTACSARSIPIAAATISYAQGRRQGRPRAADAGRARPGAARHRAHPVLFAGGARPHGAGVRHLAEPPAAGAAAGRDRARSRPPTASSPSASCPTHNARFAVPRPSPAARSCPMPASSPTSCACRRARGRQRQLRALRRAAACRSRRSATAITTSGPRCACTNIPMAGSPSSTARAAWPATSPTAASRTPSDQDPPPKSARRRGPVDLWTTLRVAHNPTGPTAAADI